MENPDFIKYLATVLFAIAVLHTLFAHKIAAFAHKFKKGSLQESFFHFLSEVEIVFGFWAFVLMLVLSLSADVPRAIAHLENLNFTEAAFVFVIMCMAATKPILSFCESWLNRISKLIPINRNLSFYLVVLILGPLLGSFITEPAAMTLSALLLRDRFFNQSRNRTFKYATIGLLFVNISIGGTLTPFAAPPVLMVAAKWGWDIPFMLANFGWRAALCVSVCTIATGLIFRREIFKLPAHQENLKDKTPFWMSLSHLIFLSLTVLYHAHMAFFVALFLIFLGWAEVTQKYQTELKIRESLLVGFFLAGLVVLGNFQSWWLQPLFEQLNGSQLFFGAAALTAVTDNAAITYLGTLIPDLSDAAKYALVAGAVTGGGLTVIANAPNPAGYGILSDSFGENGISAFGLLLAALPFTAVAAICFYVL